MKTFGDDLKTLGAGLIFLIPILWAILWVFLMCYGIYAAAHFIHKYW